MINGIGIIILRFRLLRMEKITYSVIVTEEIGGLFLSYLQNGTVNQN